MTPPRKKILFLCTGNSCRSQMAEGWSRYLHGETIESFSAGTEPHGVNPLARRVMAEAGVDLSRHTSKHLNDLSHITFDLVITVCDTAATNCPLPPKGAPRIHFPFDDPPRLAQDAPTEEEALVHYRRVRDEIRAFIESLPTMREESGTSETPMGPHLTIESG